MIFNQAIDAIKRLTKKVMIAPTDPDDRGYWYVNPRVGWHVNDRWQRIAKREYEERNARMKIVK